MPINGNPDMTDAPKFILCPYCGHPQTLADQCAACGGVFEPLSRKATQIAMGPWYIRDRNMPFRPGCSIEVLRKQIEAGRIKPNTVLRGPTTHQFWSVARNTPGISHLLGYCHECNSNVKPTDSQCHSCKTKFVIPSSRNELGLLYPTQEVAEKAQKSLTRQIDKALGRPVKDDDAAADTAQTRAPVQGGADLLDQVLGAAAKRSSRKASSGKAVTPAAAPGSQASASAPSPSQSAQPAALDFSPSAGASPGSQHSEAGILWSEQNQKLHAQAASQQGQPTGDIPAAAKGASSKLIIWLLVLSNVLVVGLLALAVWLLQKPAG